ncbi:MAG TPA: molybdopterin dinucleotide binding domain-containing protein, partial [Actinomycetota bacterium]|nr:molybdopterin dinucleotide binding domain-containing protein [Actinomycetota bacterium]
EALGSGGTVILLGPAVAADPAALGAWNAVADACGARVGWAPRRAGESGALAAGAHPELLPGWRPVADSALRSEVESAWGGPVPEQPGEDTAAVLSRARSGGLDLLWLVGADVLGDVPDARLGAEALVGAGYVVVQDVQSSDLVEFADLLLPAAAFAERDGTLTDWEGRRQPIQAGVDPPGSARADYAILSECARRLGRPIGCRRLGDVQEELSGLLDRPASAVPAPGVVSIPDPPVTRDGFPLRLLTYRLLYDAGSRVRRTEEIATLTQQPYAEMHPDDAAIAGVQDGAMAIVTSRHGRLSVPVRVSDTVRPGVVFVPYAQPGAPAQNLLTVGDRSPAVRVEPL